MAGRENEGWGRKLHSDWTHIGLANLWRQFGGNCMDALRRDKKRLFYEISGCDKCEFLCFEMRRRSVKHDASPLKTPQNCFDQDEN